jgi:hypothetical protein
MKWISDKLNVWAHTGLSSPSVCSFDCKLNYSDELCKIAFDCRSLWRPPPRPGLPDVKF